MNPHDPAQRPGAHLVSEALSVDDPWLLSDPDQSGSLSVLGRMVAVGAGHVDDLHNELSRRARSAIEILEPVGQGAVVNMRGSHGVLATIGPQIEVLSARRGAAYEHLTLAVSAYRGLLPGPDPERSSKVLDKDLNLGEVEPGRSDDVTIAGDRRLQALEAVEGGRLRFHQSGLSGDIYLSDGQGRRPTPEVWPETVQQLVADGLLDQDTSEGLYRPGQLLSLTAQGKAALRDARTATPRVSAALSRSDTTAIPGAVADPSAAPATGTAAKSSRSR
ncbi:large ATP-binding protein [Streptomyces sp. NPDC088554]|uniref:large ATP-binding protein n=1 Tax=Streptomyces sp. NPDC088554 TaxID=3365865 RepID=UPI0038121E9B